MSRILRRRVLGVATFAALFLVTATAHAGSAAAQKPMRRMTARGRRRMIARTSRQTGGA